MSHIPEVPVTAGKRPLSDRISIVWLVPLLALGVALFIAWQSYQDRGPVIEIVFESAAGVAKDETELRFRDVTVGVVEDVYFTDALDRVVVEVRLDKSVAAYVDDQAQFWIVEPEVTTQGVTGLDTVLSGVYIEGQWDDEVSTLTYSFPGLEDPPLLSGGREGLELVLQSTSGLLQGNTPILYKGVIVGQVGQAMVTPDGFMVEASAVIFAPYDDLVTETTRFWDASGFSVSVGTGGAMIDFDSIASLIAGGVTFDTFVVGEAPARNGARFDVYADGSDARASIFSTADGERLDLVATFTDDVAGLSVGAAVELNGLRIGEVSALNGVLQDTPSGGSRVALQAVLSIQPSRLGMEGQDNAEEALRFLGEQVEGGLRARLAAGNFLTGGLKVQLVPVMGAGDGRIDTAARPFPSIPVTDSDVADEAVTAERALMRINALPIEQLMESAISLMDNTSVLLGREETQAVPGEVTALLADIRGLVGAEQTQALPEQLGVLLADLETSVDQINLILGQVTEQETVTEIMATVGDIRSVAEELEGAIAGIPGLVDGATTAVNSVAELELTTLVAEITASAASIAALVESESVAALPAQVADTVAEIERTAAALSTVLVSVEEDDLSGGVAAALETVNALAADLETAIAGVPGLIEQASAATSGVAALDLDGLVEEATTVLQSARTLIGSEAAQALPEQLASVGAELEVTLAEIGALAEQLAAEDGVQRLLAAVDSASEAASAFGGSVEGVPALIERLNTIAANAEDVELTVLVDEVTAVATSARGLLEAEGTQAVPEALTSALDELAAILDAIRDGGAVENTNAALLSAREAAEALEVAVEGLPALLSRANGLIAQADTTLSGFEETSPAIRDARDALREVQEAADAVQSLARALERSPLLRR